MNEDTRISALHGAGGELMGRLIHEHILGEFSKRAAGRIGLDALDDGTTIDLPKDGELVVTTDSHTVNPIFFPGGDIGRLAAAGTLNDLAVMGARPLGLTLGLFLEEGFSIDDLKRIIRSIASVLDEVGVPLIAGDTKVLGKGELDKIAVNTTGIGIAGHAVSDSEISPGDAVIVTGTIGDHGMALLACREEFHLDTRLESDVAPIWPLIKSALEVGGIKAMKDPTRGGLATVLNEMARKSNTTIEIKEEQIPIRDPVWGLSGLLGISPLAVANEDKAVIIATLDKADEILSALRAHPLGKVTDEYPGRVILGTEVGGEALPRAAAW